MNISYKDINRYFSLLVDWSDFTNKKLELDVYDDTHIFFEFIKLLEEKGYIAPVSLELDLKHALDPMLSNFLNIYKNNKKDAFKFMELSGLNNFHLLFKKHKSMGSFLQTIYEVLDKSIYYDNDFLLDILESVKYILIPNENIHNLISKFISRYEENNKNKTNNFSLSVFDKESILFYKLKDTVNIKSGINIELDITDLFKIKNFHLNETEIAYFKYKYDLKKIELIQKDKDGKTDNYFDLSYKPYYFISITPTELFEEKIDKLKKINFKKYINDKFTDKIDIHIAETSDNTYLVSINRNKAIEITPTTKKNIKNWELFYEIFEYGIADIDDKNYIYNKQGKQSIDTPLQKELMRVLKSNEPVEFLQKKPSGICFLENIKYKIVKEDTIKKYKK